MFRRRKNHLRPAKPSTATLPRWNRLSSTPKKNKPPVIFRLWRSGGKWKVYDAVIENVSSVNNYRAQFDRVISKSSYENLKKMLKEKAG